MPGESKLSVLLSSMNPKLSDIDYIFYSSKNEDYIANLHPWAIIHEEEGIAVILEVDEANQHKIPYETIFKRITLRVHSSLDAVGLTAAIANKLKDADISANVVAGYYHDYIFVQKDKANKAISKIKKLVEENSV